MRLLCSAPGYHEIHQEGTGLLNLSPFLYILLGALLLGAAIFKLSRATSYVTVRQLWLLPPFFVSLPLSSWALDTSLAYATPLMTLLFGVVLSIHVGRQAAIDGKGQVGNALAVFVVASPAALFLLWGTTGGFNRPTLLLGPCHLLSEARRDGCMRTVFTTGPVHFFQDNDEAWLIYATGSRVWMEPAGAWDRWWSRKSFLLDDGAHQLSLIPNPTGDRLLAVQHRLLWFDDSEMADYDGDGLWGSNDVREYFLRSQVWVTSDVYWIDLKGGRVETRVTFSEEVLEAVAAEIRQGNVSLRRLNLPTGSVSAGAPIVNGVWTTALLEDETLTLHQGSYPEDLERTINSSPLQLQLPWASPEKVLWTRSVAADIDCMAFAPDRRRLVQASGNRLTSLDTATGRKTVGPDYSPPAWMDSKRELCPLLFLSADTLLMRAPSAMVAWDLAAEEAKASWALPPGWPDGFLFNHWLTVAPAGDFMAVPNPHETVFPRRHHATLIYRLE